VMQDVDFRPVPKADGATGTRCYARRDNDGGARGKEMASYAQTLLEMSALSAPEGTVVSSSVERQEARLLL
jgi:hypothetical protein